MSDGNGTGIWAWQVGGANLGTIGFGQPTIDSDQSSSSFGFIPGADGSTGSGGSTTFIIDGGSTSGGGGSTSSGSTHVSGILIKEKVQH